MFLWISDKVSEYVCVNVHYVVTPSCLLREADAGLSGCHHCVLRPVNGWDPLRLVPPSSGGRQGEVLWVEDSPFQHDDLTSCLQLRKKSFHS